MSWKGYGLLAALLALHPCFADTSTTADSSVRQGPPYGAGRTPLGPYSYSTCTTTRVGNTDSDPISQITASRVLRPVVTTTVQSIPLQTGCDGRATVNAVNATLKWWYSTTDDLPVSTVSIQFNTNDTSTGWTIYAATQTYNTSTAIQTTSCAPPYTTITYPSTALAISDCRTYPTHVAATTSPLLRDAFKTPPNTTGYKTPIPTLQITPPPASVVLAKQTFRTGTPFVQFNDYEVVRCTTNRNGTCRTATQRYKLAAPYGFKYTGPDPAKVSDVDAAVFGKLPADFPTYINRTSLTPGSWSAPPTVIIVVNRIFAAVAVLAATAYIEQSATALAIPTPQLPPGFSQVPATTPAQTTPAHEYPSARVEVTQTYLLVPGAQTSPAAQENVIETTTSSITRPTKNTEPQTPTITACLLKNCPDAQPVVVAGETLQPQLITAYVAGGQTAFSDGTAITVYGKTLSVSGGSLLVWDSGSTKTTAGSSGTLMVDGVHITPTSGVMYHGSDKTLVPGGSAVTIHGISVSVAPGGGFQIGSLATTATSSGGIGGHIIDGLGGTTTKNSASSTAEPSSDSGSSGTSNSSSGHHLASFDALWLATCAAFGFAWLMG